MGPESKNEDYTLCLDGMPIAWREPLPEITVREEGVAELAGGRVCEPVEFTAHFKTPKRWRCKNRKRFIKLMMSEGISRNYAERLADFVRGWMPYGKAWREYLWKKL